MVQEAGTLSAELTFQLGSEKGEGRGGGQGQAGGILAHTMSKKQEELSPNTGRVTLGTEIPENNGSQAVGRS